MARASAFSSVFPAVILAVAAGYFAGFLLFASDLPQPPKAVEHADGIVALTGGGARLDAAVGLLEEGAGRRLLISGVHPATTKADIKRIAHGHRKFDCCVDLGFSAADTHGNASETTEWVRSHGYRSIIVVTARYHMPRTLNEFAADMPDVKLEPYPVEPDGIDLAAWWRDPKALRVLSAEYAKFLASIVLTHVEPHPAHRTT